MSALHILELEGHGRVHLHVSDGESRPGDAPEELAMSGGKPWPHTRYRVRIAFDGRELRTTYSQGTGYAVGAVDPVDVLASLVADYHSGEWESFEGWAEENELEPDSRAARRTYDALERNRERMARVFGDALSAVLETWADR